MHADPELLALLALGEEAGTEEDRAHVRSCALCTAELAQLQRVVELGRSTAAVAITHPSPRVWAAIRDALDAEAGVRRSHHELRAHARLGPVLQPWSHASGAAELSTDGLGRRLLQVTLHADLPADGVRQAWLVHRDDPAVRQSLGILDGPYGLWTVAHTIDLAEYPILDISQQSVGSTDHSGHTIVRGALVPVG